ncbi:acyltransferase [Ectopseudomonas mendocina]|nr:acyltransferase family protein [Pseudomonas mendocina]TXR40082.1 acyltransferase [Pseudomonas mendocina]
MRLSGFDVFNHKKVVALTQSGFRSDINGLRAWAVVVVVLYHFAVPGFPGGFAGVDVFFVISGFLMAGIVVGGLQRERFSLGNFYLARARRIIPALLVLVLVLLVVGWFLLMPSDYKVLGRHARESLMFTSNMQYLSEAGYFDVASHDKWLLHTWSLSVEWQFYLLYPLVLLGLKRVLSGPKAMFGVHLLALLGSFAFCLWLTFTQPDKAFYLLPARAWELLLGGSLFLLGQHWQLPARHALWVEGLGFGLIILSITLVTASQPWPGVLALLPVLGGGAVLLAQRDSFWTGSAVAQWLGTRSYSIYLWHWPLAVGLVYFSLQHVWYWVVLGLLGSLLLGHVSYALVEVPTRRWLGSRSAWRSFFWILLAVLIVLAIAMLVRRSGFPERLPDGVARVEFERDNKNPRQSECLKADAQCIFGGGSVRAWVVGDSHADAIVTAVAAALPRAEDGVYFRGDSGCLFIQGASWAKGNNDGCKKLVRDVSDELSELYPGVPLIVINRTSAYVFSEENLDLSHPSPEPIVYFSERRAGNDPRFQAEFRQHYLDTLCKITESRPVYVLRPVPEMPVHVPMIIGRAMLRGSPVEVSISREQYDKRHAFVRALQDEAAQQCGIHLLDPAPYFCDEQVCQGTREGTPLYVDDDHLSEFGNRFLVPLFTQVFSENDPSGEQLAGE